MNQTIEKNQKSQKSQNRLFDIAKWVISILLIASIVIGNQLFHDSPLLYRVLMICFLSTITILVISTTKIGLNFLNLLLSSKKELLKVVWPNKQETMQTTLIVLFIITLMALILWALDSFFAYLISLFVS